MSNKADELLLFRNYLTKDLTMGELWYNGQFECYTLEDAVRDVKIPGETAIPAGRYEVVITYSARFDERMPLLLNVPGFEGIRIHPGNMIEDTSGCILVGMVAMREIGRVAKSRAAFLSLFQKLDAAHGQRKIYITIEERKDAPLGEKA